MSIAELQGTPVYPDLRMDRRYDGSTVTLVLDGELDLAASRALEGELHKAERLFPERIVLDFAGVEFIDSSGVHVLLEADQRAKRNGFTLGVRHVSGQAERLFRITRLDERLLRG